MAPLVQYLLVAWVGVAVLLFVRVARPVAVITICLMGTLFLPQVQSSPVMDDAVRPLRLPMLEFAKFNVISYGLLAGWLLIDGGRLRLWRPGIWDLPVAAFCLSPAASSLLNGSDVNSAFADFRNTTLLWGIPYVVGRVYLSDVPGCWRVTAALALGGIIYVPFCLYEIAVAPHLHRLVYDFYQHEFAQTMRFGGYRPMVFMQHGLAVGFFMVAASLCLTWLWRCGAWPFVGLPAWLWRFPAASAGVLTATAVACKSFGALALGVAGAATLWLSARLRTRLALVALMAVPPGYFFARVNGLWKGDDLVAWVGRSVQQERSQSLEFRLENEEKMIAAVGRQWVWGLGGNLRARPLDDNDKPIILDGLWIIVYSDTGTVGVAALIAIFLLPAARFLVANPPGSWESREVAPAAVGSIVLTLFLIDCLFNAMPNPMYMLLAAALNGWNDTVAQHQSAAKVC